MERIVVVHGHGTSVTAGELPELRPAGAPIAPAYPYTSAGTELTSIDRNDEEKHVEAQNVHRNRRGRGRGISAGCVRR